MSRINESCHIWMQACMEVKRTTAREQMVLTDELSQVTAATHCNTLFDWSSVGPQEILNLAFSDSKSNWVTTQLFALPFTFSVLEVEKKKWLFAYFLKACPLPGHTEIYCTILQHTATHFFTLHHTVSHGLNDELSQLTLQYSAT